MAKCSGVIGYALAGETQPGVWDETIIEKKYYGEVVRDNRKITDAGEMNGSIHISNNISVVSNSFMLENMSFMRYISFMNSKWKISSVEIKHPRIIMTIGGIYNGK